MELKFLFSDDLYKNKEVTETNNATEKINLFILSPSVFNGFFKNYLNLMS